MRHFLDIAPVSVSALHWILDEALTRKQNRPLGGKALPDADAPAFGRIMASIFEKNSTRTRISFDLAMRQLGGQGLTLNAADLQLGRGEPIADTARILSSYVDAVMIRALAHETVLEFARFAQVPILNGLTNRSHPCQIIADLMTLREEFGTLAGLKLAWIGDGNNVCNSLIEAAGKFDFALDIAGPRAYAPAADLCEAARAQGARLNCHDDLASALNGADAVLTDVWVSMGDQDEAARRAAFAPFRVDAAAMRLATPRAVFLHCLPAIRGEEVSADVLEGPQSRVWREAENRLHAQKAILLWCWGAGPD